MSRSVVIVNKDGRLVAARGDGSVEAEPNGHYSKFAGRILGEYVEPGYASSRKSALRFGWNDSGTLVVAKGSSDSEWVQGDLVDIRSAKVSISGDLSVGGHDLQDIINESLASAFDLGIKGRRGEISVSVSDYEDSSGSAPYAPLRVCTIGLDETILNRIETLEREMHTSVPSSVVFGKGLMVDVEETSQSSSSDDDPSFRRNVSVRIDASTMKFTGTTGLEKISVNTTDTPVPDTDENAKKPITASGVYNFVPSSIASAFELGIKGKEGEIDIDVSDDELTPLKVCTISLDPLALDKMLEFGSGLKTEVSTGSSKKLLSVNLDPSTMKFIYGSSGSDMISVDTTDTPVPDTDENAKKPITASGVYNFVPSSIASAFELGIKGEEGEIDINVSEYSGSTASDKLPPLKVCTISLDPLALDKMLEFGRGLKTEASSGSSKKLLSVNLDPSTMKFTGTSGLEMISIDTTDTPVPDTDENAHKPITASGVYNFVPKYNIEKIGERYQLKDVYEKVQEIIEKLTGES